MIQVTLQNLKKIFGKEIFRNTIDLTQIQQNKNSFANEKVVNLTVSTILNE